MKHWEYLLQQRIENVKEAEPIFSKLGLLGWVYCGIVIAGSTSKLVFRRELEE